MPMAKSYGKTNFFEMVKMETETHSKDSPDSSGLIFWTVFLAAVKKLWK